MMRGGEIGLNMPLDMVRQVLAGMWAEYVRDGWHVMSTPLFTVMEKVCQPGPNVFPLKVERQTYADIVYDGGCSKQLIKPGQNKIDITGQASFVRIVLFGQGEK